MSFYFSETSPNTKVSVVESVRIYNNFLHEISMVEICSSLVHTTR
jgi:hypothetical protein